MKLPRIMISAPSSGSGKTLITCGILKALTNRKQIVSSFKCGPDYIDPMFHSKIIGIKSKNIDTFFTDEKMTKYLFCESAKESDISVIEGVMGYYDGVKLTSFEGSSYDIANTLNTPVVLVVDCKGKSLSIFPEIEGFINFVEKSRIKGVILNRISKGLFEDIKILIEERLEIKVFGYLPTVKELVIESRHLGLVTPEEIENLDEKISRLAEIIETTIELDEIIKVATDTEEIISEEPIIPFVNDKPVIAVAKDEAFCFYYEDNLKLLEKMGAKLKYFSPIYDENLPTEADAILLGGGYPEIYGRKLSENKTMLTSIKSAIDSQMPCLAECGGFMYLHESMEDMEGINHSMVGVIKGITFKTNKLNRFGYINLISREKQLLGNKGEMTKGHEFHYFESENCGNSFLAKKPSGKKEWECICGNENLAAGFPHIYYYSNFSFPYNFLKKAIEWRERQIEWQNQ